MLLMMRRVVEMMEVTEVMMEIQKEGVEKVFPLASASRARFLVGAT